MTLYVRLAPPIPKNVYHDRSSSMSRVSSYDMRDFQVYTVQRPWQSNPDLRMEKWKPVTTCGSTLTPSSANESLETVDVVKKKKLMAQLFQEREAEEHSYRFKNQFLLKCCLTICIHDHW